MEYKIHPVEWNDEKVKRFWDYYNNNPAFESLWFSKAVGQGIIQFTSKFLTVKGKILDYGIGKGHFAEYLLKDENRELYACDFSQETVNNINNTFRGKKNFKGCSLVEGFPSHFASGDFDIVFLIEAIEHLTDDYLLPTLGEAKRLLKTGGHFIITTPNSEKLEEQHVICPDCGGVFHRVQHVRSFNTNQLDTLVTSYGFKTLQCIATDFHEYGEKGFMYKIRNASKKLLQSAYKPPHLIYIGQKTEK